MSSGSFIKLITKNILSHALNTAEMHFIKYLHITQIIPSFISMSTSARLKKNNNSLCSNQKLKHKQTAWQLTKERVNLSQWLAVRWKSLLFTAYKDTEMLSVLAEKDIWASSATGPMWATCGWCRTIATANREPQTHTHRKRCVRALLNRWGLIERMVSQTRWGRGGVEGGWGIRECFIQHVLGSLSVAHIYTAPPIRLTSALPCVWTPLLEQWPSTVSCVSDRLTCLSQPRPLVCPPLFHTMGLQTRSPNNEEDAAELQ